MQSPSDFILEEVIVLNSAQKNIVDITPLVGELTIFENIQLPYLTGMIMVRDDNRLYDGLDINGTEILQISLKSTILNAKVITKFFQIHHVASSAKVSDNVEALAIQLIESNGFNNSAISVNQAYSGTPDIIIKKILADHLNITNTPNIAAGSGISGPAVKPFQASMKVVIPNMSPFAACNWILKTMTTTLGMPYYLYSTLNGNNLQLRSFEEMLTQPVWNNETPYQYNIAHAQNSGVKPEDMIMNVTNFATKNSENVLRLLNNGSIGSDVGVTDITTGQRLEYHFNVDSVFRQLVESGVISTEERPIHNSSYRTFSHDNIGQLNNYSVNKIMATNTHPGFNNYSEQNNSAKLKLQSVNQCIRQLMGKSAINFAVNGLPFLAFSNASIGRKVKFEYSANDANKPGEKDKKRSGDYVIHSTRHSFNVTDQRHQIDMHGVKLGNPR